MKPSGLIPFFEAKRMVIKEFRLDTPENIRRFYKEVVVPNYLLILKKKIEMGADFSETLSYDSSNGIGIVYKKYIPFPNLNQVLPISVQNIESIIEHILSSLAEIHVYGRQNLSVLKEMQPNLEQLITQFDFSSDLKERFIYRVNANIKTDLLEKYNDDTSIDGLFRTLPIEFCHLDPHPSQWIIDDKNGLYLIDWKKTALAPGIYDLPFILEDPVIRKYGLDNQKMIAHYIEKKEQLSNRSFSEGEKNLTILGYDFASIHASLCYAGKIFGSKDKRRWEDLGSMLGTAKSRLKMLADKGILEQFYYSVDRYLTDSGLYEAAVHKPMDAFEEFIQQTINSVFKEFKSLWPEGFP